MVRWKPTSNEDLARVDQKILSTLPCVTEQKMVTIDDDQQLWTIKCNPDGKGTPLVLVHGMGGGVGLWSMNLEALSQNRPVYAFDLLGFGRSSRPAFSSDPEEAEDKFVDSIEAFRRKVGLDKFILLGHSLGGYLSASYALRFPQHIKHLILADPWGMSEKNTNSLRSVGFFFRVVVGVVSHFNPMATIRALGPWGPGIVKRYRPGLAQIFATKWGNDQLLHEYIYHCNAQTPSGEVGFKSLTMSLGWAKRPMIHRMGDICGDLPITFVYGSRTWMDRTAGLNVKHLRPDSYVDVQVLRGAGHHVYAERWDLFNSLIQSITTSVDKGEEPKLDVKLVRRMHDHPTNANLADLDHPGMDFEQPPGHGDENVGKEKNTTDDSPDVTPSTSAEMIPDVGQGDGELLDRRSKAAEGYVCKKADE
ncbi:hypothetical protein BaRGS_00030557 [Batillaria attramentaria]|uniref:1-acylglycerol-3-phosphate O-acyltransferase ABHD5 n=1 Tax=Batillaria attramentaria TaxID=370345 RepID=A0ABD0JTU2_9CAEN